MNIFRKNLNISEFHEELTQEGVRMPIDKTEAMEAGTEAETMKLDKLVFRCSIFRSSDNSMVYNEDLHCDTRHPITLGAGKYNARIKCPGYRAEYKAFEIKEGKDTELEMELIPENANSEEKEPEVPATGKPGRLILTVRVK